jgi:hypothetical protein
MWQGALVTPLKQVPVLLVPCLPFYLFPDELKMWMLIGPGFSW